MKTGARTQTTVEVLEGRLLAQRKVLAALVSAVLGDAGQGRERLRKLVSRDAMNSEHSEDPGVLPDAAFAIEAAIDAELRLIADAVAEMGRPNPK